MQWLRSTLSSIGAAFTSSARGSREFVSLVPTYLSHLLYLISQEFRDLVGQGYGANSAVYACVKMLQNSIPEPPLVAYIQNRDGTIGDQIAWDDPFRVQIRHPNPLMTEYQRWETITVHLAIVGISHWWKERDKRGRVIAEWPLRPDRVGPIYGDASKGEPVLVGWSYLVPGSLDYIGIPAGDVITYRFPHPGGESGGIAEGLGPLQVLATEIAADNSATSLVGNLLSNYAQPGVVIKVNHPIASEDDAKMIKASYMQHFSGVRQGEPAVIDEGSDIIPVGFNLQQLEFPQLRRVSESRIASALGVPAILVGLQVGLESGVRATIDEQRAHFTETTLVSYWRRYSDQYTKDMAHEFGENYVCHFDLTKVRALAGQADLQISRIKDAYERGALTRAEYRAALGYDSLPEDDVYVFGIAPGRGMETATTPEMQPKGTPTSNGHLTESDTDIEDLADATA